MAQASPSLLSGRGWGNILYIYHSWGLGWMALPKCALFQPSARSLPPLARQNQRVSGREKDNAAAILGDRGRLAGLGSAAFLATFQKEGSCLTSRI